jgi:hypothetical protein
MTLDDKGWPKLTMLVLLDLMGKAIEQHVAQNGRSAGSWEVGNLIKNLGYHLANLEVGNGSHERGQDR